MTDMVYFTTRNREIPRIVAAKLKSQFRSKIGFNDCGIKPRISGDLRIVDKSFRHLRYAEVRDGCLILHRYVGSNKIWDFHIPLYNLNINLDSPKHCCQFSLSKFGEIAPIATFQVVKEHTYKKWLKTLAVEVIRQTPLNTLKFMDILFINELLEKRQDKSRNRWKLQPKLSKLKSANTSNRINYSFHDENDSSNAHTYDPLNSSHGFIDTRDDSLRCDAFDKHSPNQGVDSGYCSLQSGYGKSEISESETGSVKQFEELFQKFQQLGKEKRIRGENHLELEKPNTKLDKAATSSNNIQFASENNKPPDSSDKENHLPDISICCHTPESSNPDIFSSVLKSGHRSLSPNLCRGSEFFDEKPNASFGSQLDITKKSSLTWDRNGNRMHSIPDVLKDLPDTLPRTKRKPCFDFSEELLQKENANVLVRLLTKCQIDKEYVPVREKRILFESLSRFSFSVDNLKKRIIAEPSNNESFVKFRSLSDLNRSQVPVSTMRKYFESFNEKDEK